MCSQIKELMYYLHYAILCTLIIVLNYFHFDENETIYMYIYVYNNLYSNF